MKGIQLKRLGLRQCFMYLLLLGIFVLMIPDMLKGIDLTDMAYMVSRYKYVFDQEVPINDAAIIVTDILGGILYHAVPEGQVRVLSLACWALNYGIALLSFRLLREYLNEILLMIILIGGGFFSIAFIHVVHYDTFSMFFQVLAFCVLIKGLDHKNKRLIIISGFILGINVFVRLPNILQTSFGILIVWYVGNNNRKTIISYITKFVIGISSGGLFGVLLCSMTLGKSGIKSMMSNTIETLGDSSSSHSIMSIILRFLEGIWDGVHNTIKYEMILIFYVILLSVLVKIYFKKRDMLSKKTWMVCYRIVVIVSIIFILVWVVVLTKELSHIPILEILVTDAIIICIISAFYLRKRNIRLSTICLGCVFMELILTIGTNNGTAFYVIFMGFPMSVTICALWECLGYRHNLIKASCKYIMSLFLIALLTIEGYQYYNTYVYRDSMKKKLNCEIDIKEYRGIKTSAERAEYLEKLVRILNPYDHCQLIALGDFSIGYVITDMIPFFSTTWPDLTSYGIKKFQKEMEDKLDQHIYPVIVLADVYQTGNYRASQKSEMVLDSIIKNEKYKMVYADKYYRIYVPIEKKGK